MAEKIGKYETIRVLGRGATAVVYLARDPDSGKEVAIKLMRFGDEHAAVSRRLRKLFQTESSVGRRLDHPHIVKIYDAHLASDHAYLVMEFVNGTSLEHYCAINELLPMHRAVGIIFKCCLALDHAYRQGVIHRDIKPANILIDKDDNPKITDFGLALNLSRNEDKNSTFVMGVGSPAYMSPEQIKNYPLNQKTDLYSLGVLLFQLLTGRLPFRANNAGALAYKIINMDIPSVCALNPNLPAALDPILKKALEKDLYNRYRNGTEFAKDLSSVRYQIYNENDPVQDFTRFKQLRKLTFFTEFEDVEIWEILRIGTWRKVDEKIVLIGEGEENRIFGVVVSGAVEVSVGRKVISRLNAGEVIGEMAYLHPRSAKRSATVTTLEPTLFLEINSAALDLGSDELIERFKSALIIQVVIRLRSANKILAERGQTAVVGRSSDGQFATTHLSLSDL